MTCLMIDDNVTMASLLKYSSPLFPRQKWPPALILALCSERVGACRIFRWVLSLRARFNDVC